MQIIQSFLTRNPCYQKNVNPPKDDSRWLTFQRRGPLGLMLHSIGCPQPNAQVLINSWNHESYGTACVHGFIDGNTGVAYQCLPWNYRGWHGGGSSNNTHIGVEMCEPACIRYTGGANFTCSDLATALAVAQRTYNTAVELFAFLCEKYGLDPLKPGVVVSHAEGYKLGIATNHGDPEHLWRQLGMKLTMDGFRRDVKATMDKNKSQNQNKEEEELAKVYKDIQDVPSYWRDDIKELLKLECINGGTPADVDADDVNLTEDCIKAIVIIKRYVDTKYAGKGGK